MNPKRKMRIRTFTTCLVVCLCLTGTAWGQEVKVGEQGGVSVVYNKSKNEFTVKNNSGYEILLFKDKANHEFAPEKVEICNLYTKEDISVKSGENSPAMRPNGKIESLAYVVCYKVTWRPPKLQGKISIPISISTTGNVSTPATTTPAATPATSSTSAVSSTEQPKQTTKVETPSHDEPKKAEIDYELIKKVADNYRINQEYDKAISEYQKLLLIEAYREYAGNKIKYCEAKRNEMFGKPSASTPKPKEEKIEKPKVQDNSKLIADFEKRTASLQENCNTLLQQNVLSPKDSTLLTGKLKLCKNLSSEIEKSKLGIKIQADEATLQGFIEQIAALRKEIVNRLTPLSSEAKFQLMEAFRNAVSYAQDSASLSYVKNFIDENKYKSDWYNWWGKGAILDSLDNIEISINASAVECKRFIDSILTIPGYKNAEAFITDFEYEFINNIQNRVDEYRTILNGDDFKRPVGKITMVVIIFFLILIFAGILLYMMIHNKIKEKEKERKEKEKEEKLGKSTFKKIDATHSVQSENAPTSSFSVSDKPKIKQLLKKYEPSLAEVKANIGKQYLEINMFDLVEDSSIHKVYASRDFIKELYKFFNEFLKLDSKVPETGCHIIGRWDYAPNTNQQGFDISLEYIIKPGSDAKYSEFECDFGAEIGTTLIMANRKYSEQTNTEYVHTSWMHSHPGLQLFLSKQDLIVQNTLTNNSPYKRMLAIVIDTKTEHLEMAFFSPKTSEQQIINNDTDIKKTLNLDELLKWAKTPYVESQQSAQPQREEQTDMKVIGTAPKEYFDIANKFKITREVSVDMLTATEGFLIGKQDNNQIFIDELSADEENTKSNVIGLFKEISTFENGEEWEKEKQCLLSDDFWTSNKVLIIYCLQEENLYFFAQKPAENIQDIKNMAIIIPFQELKIWTRKNRS